MSYAKIQPEMNGNPYNFKNHPYFINFPSKDSLLKLITPIQKGYVAD